MNLNKTNWDKIKLGDAFIKREENDKENAKNRFDRFLKVNHMEAETLHVKDWSSQKNGDELNPYFYKIFRKGQILFPTRNPHLRRAALASFDGITGEKTLTLEPNKDVLVPEFIPFLFHSEGFYSHTTSAIIGSTNPHCRWRDVASYEFFVPSKSEQLKLSKLLWAIDDVVESELNLLDKININIEVRTSELIWKSGFPLKPIKEFAHGELEKFVDGDWIESKDQSESGVRLLQLADIGVREFINKSQRFVSEETFKRLKCFEVLPEDVLIARMPEPIGRACIIPKTEEKMITAVDCCIARVDRSRDSNKYLMYLLNSREFLHKAGLLASGTTRQRIARKTLEEMKVPKPSLAEQSHVVSIIDSLIKSRYALLDRLSASRALQKSIINQIF